jgi:hypothetical protein
MSNYKKRYSLRERKADKLWAEWHPEEGTPAFWQAYDELLLRARKVQKNVVISQANISVPPPVTVQQQTTATTPTPAVKVPLLRVMFLTLALFFTLGVVLYLLTNSRPAEQPVLVDAVVEEVYEPIVKGEATARSWQKFSADQEFRSSYYHMLPDSLAIAHYKEQELPHTIREIEDNLKEHKKVIQEARRTLRENNNTENLFALERLKKNYEVLWGDDEQKLKKLEQELTQARQWYKQAYRTYLKARRKKALSVIGYQRIENAWNKVIDTTQLPKNIDKHNQPIYDLRVKKEMTWLFVTNMYTMSLHRVMSHKGEYFTLNSFKQLKPIDPANQTVYRAQLKVYYFGQLVTYTPQKVYYEVNGKQHKIAIKDFDKLEKRMEVTEYQPTVKR